MDAQMVVGRGRRQRHRGGLHPRGRSRHALLCRPRLAGAVNCRFCSTGNRGFSRNLSTARSWASCGGPSICCGESGLAANGRGARHQQRVLMGWRTVAETKRRSVTALRLMLDDNAYGLSRRRVTLSTSGMVPQMDRPALDCPVALAFPCMPQRRVAHDWFRSIASIRARVLARAGATCANARRDFITFDTSCSMASTTRTGTRASW